MVIVILGSNSNDGNVGDNYNKECGDKNDDNNNNDNDNGNHYSDDSE